jgi:hypothetical protein
MRGVDGRRASPRMPSNKADQIGQFIHNINSLVARPVAESGRPPRILGSTRIGRPGPNGRSLPRLLPRVLSWAAAVAEAAVNWVAGVIDVAGAPEDD